MVCLLLYLNKDSINIINNLKNNELYGIYYFLIYEFFVISIFSTQIKINLFAFY